MSRPPFLPRLLAPRLPFYYGWVILGCVCLAAFARGGAAVAVLTNFVTPMTAEFGWSRTEFSGAVSLGGLLAALVSPLLGPFLDRSGARLVLCLAVLGNGLAMLALAHIDALWMFYLLFCFARLNWASPFDLGTQATLNNWFIARRRRVAPIANLSQTIGLMVLPLIAQAAMVEGGWRAGWVAVGISVLAVGFLPCFLFLARRPEDLAIAADPPAATGAAMAGEAQFTRAAALRTSAFWLLVCYTVLIYPVQAGVSLHQVPHLMERGLSPLAAASSVAIFSAGSIAGAILVGVLPRAIAPRLLLFLAAALKAIGAMLLIFVGSAWDAGLATGLFGLGLGVLQTMLAIAWADYFGRASYGAIRGVALSAQVLAQAAGPVLSGVLRDVTGTYTLSLIVAALLAGLAALLVLAVKPPVPVR